MDHPTRRPSRPAVPPTIARLMALVIALGAMPIVAGSAGAATTTDFIANCNTNLRTAPELSASVADVIDSGAVVSADTQVSGDAWSASCAGSVSGDTWLRIVAVGGASVSDLYGVSAVYAASGLFRVSGRLEGIDVSHWQGSIDFAKVAAAGKRFVIAKATEGIGWTDAKWSRYRTDATAAGLVFGGYHFARPDGNPTKPREEAAWFVSQLNLVPGMLPPVLDLERHGGLSKAALTAWVQAWLDEVYARTGERAMIYVSPAFWRTYLGDTRTFADQGYDVLWIAHWGVNSPSVPASNWGGKGWTFWQYTSDGTVPGISGRVDLNRYNGTDLTRVIVGADFRLGSSPSSRTVVPGAGTSFSIDIDRDFFTLPVELSVSGLPAGATASVSPSPSSGSSATVNVSTRSGSTPLGSYAIKVTGTAMGLSRTTTMTLTVADGDPPTVTAPTSGLYYLTQHLASGQRVRTSWSASDLSGITSYQVQRQVNGGSWSTVSLSSSKATSMTQPLNLGTKYRYRVRATDGAGNTSSWKYGTAFTPRRTQQTSSAVTYGGTWKTQYTSGASGGSRKYTTAAGAWASFTFTGSSIAWVAARSASRGSADVYIDGVFMATINLYSPTYSTRATVFAYNWADSGRHTIKIVARGTSGHPRVDIDAFVRFILG